MAGNAERLMILRFPKLRIVGAGDRDDMVENDRVLVAVLPGTQGIPPQEICAVLSPPVSVPALLRLQSICVRAALSYLSTVDRTTPLDRIEKSTALSHLAGYFRSVWHGLGSDVVDSCSHRGQIKPERKTDVKKTFISG